MSTQLKRKRSAEKPEPSRAKRQRLELFAGEERLSVVSCLKRKLSLGVRSSTPSKRQKLRPADRNHGNNTGGILSTPDHSPQRFQHPVLSSYYDTLLTLRNYIIARIGSSRLESHKKIVRKLKDKENESHELRKILDHTIVALHGPVKKTGLIDDIKDASQIDRSALRSSATFDTNEAGYAQSEVVDVVVNLLFARHPRSKPKNILTNGFKLAYGFTPKKQRAGIIGVDVETEYPNNYYETVKSKPWQELLKVVGEDAMFDVLMNTNLFSAIGHDNYYQLAGTPLEYNSNAFTEASIANPPSMTRPIKGRKIKSLPTPRALSAIVFETARMMYSKPLLNSKGQVTFGLRHNHVLNRIRQEDNSLHIMKYIFPKEFGLHNVFTSWVDKSETQFKLKEYTDREAEIMDALAMKYSRAAKAKANLTEDTTYQERKGNRNAQNDADSGNFAVPVERVPKRLNNILPLVKKLQKLHSRCSYHALLKHYCPVYSIDGKGIPPEPRIPDINAHLPSSEPFITQKMSSSASTAEDTQSDINETDDPKAKYQEYACNHGQVKAFVRAVIRNVIPKAFFGSEYNENLIMKSVDLFIGLRLRESLSLGEVMQDLKITEFDWLAPPNFPQKAKISLPDHQKRQSLLAEFLYYLFDSFIIPLLSANFFVTGTASFKSRRLYFRHDIWKKLSEPVLGNLLGTMFERVHNMKIVEEAIRGAGGKLGIASLRLLPKEEGVRPITNCRKRPVLKSNGKTILGKSINMRLAPIYNVLSYEKSRNPKLLGASCFSQTDAANRIAAFRAHLSRSEISKQSLYFVKLDVQSCYDTVPQEALLEVADIIVQSEEYVSLKHTEFASIRKTAVEKNKKGIKRKESKVVAKWPEAVRDADDFTPFEDLIKREVGEKKKESRVFVEKHVKDAYDKAVIVDLLRQHIQNNIVQIGNKFYRQKTGIPQGSRLSSLLCNFFYAHLERTYLSFTDDSSSLLLRLTDDFLYITPHLHLAQSFLSLMLPGVPSFGITVNPAKTLVNFPFLYEGKQLQTLDGERKFPYAGILIDTRTLSITKDRTKSETLRKPHVLADHLALSYRRAPLANLQQKSIKAFATAMLPLKTLDTGTNDANAVIGNIEANFRFTARKFCESLRILISASTRQQPPASKTLIKIIANIVLSGERAIRARVKKGVIECRVSRRRILWVGLRAFEEVIRRKQFGGGWGEVRRWVEDGVEGGVTGVEEWIWEALRAYGKFGSAECKRVAE